MRVRCKINVVDEVLDFRTRERLAKCVHRDGLDEDLVVGNIYFVFALARWIDGGFRVYLHTIEESHHPYPYPLEMFEVIDSSMPQNWCVNFEQQQGGLELKQISFAEWTADCRFYEKLVDGDEEAINSYNLQRLNV